VGTWTGCPPPTLLDPKRWSSCPSPAPRHDPSAVSMEGFWASRII